MLETDELRAYTEGLFDFVFVNVGRMNQNRQVAERLGVDFSRGIPVAILYAPDGTLIGVITSYSIHYTKLYEGGVTGAEPPSWVICRCA